LKGDPRLMSSTPPIIEMEASFSPDERVLETPLIRSLDRAMFFTLASLLIFGPLAFGATEPWSLAILQSGVALLALLWCSRQLAARAIVFHPSALFYPVLLFGMLILAQLVIGNSAYRDATAQGLGDFATYSVALAVTTQLFFYGQRLRNLAEILTWFGLAVATFAILQSLTSEGTLYWVRTPTFSSSIYGPYVNRNHYAGLMEMLMPFSLAVAFGRRSSPGKKLVAGFATLLISASIFLSRSRGGTVAFIAELIFFGVITSNLRKKKGIDWKAIALFVGLAALLLWLDVSPALERWTAFEGDIQAGRAAILKDGLKMFLDKPLMGWGLGTFPYVYPQFRTFYTDYYINQAHNDPLQVLVETGALGAATMFWFMIALYRFSLRKLARARANASIDSGSAVRLAALTGCTGLAVHSLVDFNLHIPANALMFFTLCAIACWGAAEAKNPDDADASHSSDR
jgi:O-antigen ligase